MKNYKIINLKPITKWLRYAKFLFIAGITFIFFTLFYAQFGNGIDVVILIVGLGFTLTALLSFKTAKADLTFLQKIQATLETKEHFTLSELSTLVEADQAAVKSALNLLAKEGCLIDTKTEVPPKEFIKLQSTFSFENLKKVDKFHIDLIQYRFRSVLGSVQLGISIMFLTLGIDDVILFINGSQDFTLVLVLNLLIGATYLFLSIDTVMKHNYAKKIKRGLEDSNVITIDDLVGSTGISKNLLIHSLERFAGEGCLIDLNALDRTR